MITGMVDADGVPVIDLEADGKTWRAAVDTGFNGLADSGAQVRIHVALGELARVQGDAAEARPSYADALRIYRAPAPAPRSAQVVLAAGNAPLALSEREAARELLEQAVSLAADAVSREMGAARVEAGPARSAGFTSRTLPGRPPCRSTFLAESRPAASARAASMAPG